MLTKKSSAFSDLIHGLHQQIRSELPAGHSPDVYQLTNLYNLIVASLVNKANGCAGCLVFLDHDDGEFERIYSTGYEKGSQWWQFVGFGDGLVSLAIKQNQVIITEDVAKAPGYVRLCSSTKSQITIPLRNSLDKLFAVFVVEYSHKPIAAQIKWVASKMSIHLLEDLLEEVEEYIFSRRMSVAFVQLQRIAEAPDEDSAIAEVLAAIKTIVGRGEIAVIKRIGGKLRVVASENIAPESLPEDLDIGISTGRGYTCQVAHTQTSFYCKNTSDRKRYQNYRDVVRTTLSQYTAPLVFRKELIGVLNVGAEIPFAFSSHDRQLLDTFAQHAAYSMFYQRLLTELVGISHIAKQKLHSFDFLRNRLFANIDPNVKRIADTVGDTISAAKALMEEMAYPYREPKIEECDLSKLLDAIVETRFSAICSERGIILKREITPLAHYNYTIAKRHFNDIVENLLWNAIAAVIKAESPQITVSLSLERPQDYPEARHSDTMFYSLTVANPGVLTRGLNGVEKQKAMDELLAPARARPVERGIGHWTCDRLLALYGGYLHLSDEGGNVRATAYFRK